MASVRVFSKFPSTVCEFSRFICKGASFIRSRNCWFLLQMDLVLLKQLYEG